MARLEVPYLHALDDTNSSSAGVMNTPLLVLPGIVSTSWPETPS
jgi:hypothetical protein